jgi:chemotaxis receptor (MCP) glutamine deamidase CheD
LLQVGRKNIVAALATLQQFGLNVSYSDLGGYSGRRLLVDCANYSCTVSPITPAPGVPAEGRTRRPWQDGY